MNGTVQGLKTSGRVLHAGCGTEKLPSYFEGCEETRVDIDPATNPDIVSDILNLGDIGEFDIVYCSHTLEHLFEYQIVGALKEFLRVLKPGGFAMLFVPNLSGVLPNKDVVYESPAGPICGLDMYYGKTEYLHQNTYMAHHTGFVPETLKSVLYTAGFSVAETSEMSGFNLLGVGIK